MSIFKEEQRPPVVHRPVIGLSCDWLEGRTGPRHSIRDSYVSAIINAGGLPLIIPATEDQAALYALYEMMDGLLFTGGADIDPAVYGESLDGTEAEGISDERDSAELRLARWALADDLPVLGICRGHQLLNVAAGGTLYQDIPAGLPQSAVDHRGSTYTDDRSLLTHKVSLEPGCRLAAVFGATELAVNSLHHQGVKQPGSGLRVVGTGPDGLAEALEGSQHSWLFTVQWHPEELWQKQTAASHLFKAFVEAAAGHLYTRQANSVSQPVAV